MPSSVPHPYYPPGVEIHGYEANTMPLWRMLALFGGIVGLFVGSAYFLARQNPRLGSGDHFSAAWFALCGFLHCFFEGYFVLNSSTIASSDALFAQLWKEYTLSDSRYLTGDVFTLCVETCTVIAWGPLSLTTAASIIYCSPRRHFLQTIVSTAHLYGVCLYYYTNYVEDVSYSRPETLYFWLYYVGFNAPWVFVPLWLLRTSCKEISRAMENLEENESRRKEA